MDIHYGRDLFLQQAQNLPLYCLPLPPGAGPSINPTVERTLLKPLKNDGAYVVPPRHGGSISQIGGHMPNKFLYCGLSVRNFFLAGIQQVFQAHKARIPRSNGLTGNIPSVDLTEIVVQVRRAERPFLTRIVKVLQELPSRY